MHIINAMFGARAGGLEQAAVDYAESLIMEGHQVTTILNPNSPLKDAFHKTGSSIVEMVHFGEWDFIAKFRLKLIIKKIKPDCVVTHGRRAALLCKHLHPHVFPVTHSGYQAFLKDFPGLLAMTNHLRQEFIDYGYPATQIYYVPNMVRVGNAIPTPGPYHTPIRLGSMGRLEEKKGFQILIQAVKHLQDQGYDFQLTLAGEGTYKEKLQQLVSSLCLEKIVHFPGWIKESKDFFQKTDIFCLPSLKEPFGIVLLEAFRWGIPTVASDADGPKEIATDQKDALVVPRNNPEALAEAIKILMKDPELGKELSKNAFEKVQSVYNIKIVAKRLTTVLSQLLERT